MRAVVTEDFGSPPVLTDLGAPIPGPGEVRVRVQSSSLNGFDIAMARGYLKGLMEHRFPAVLGRDFAGTVDLVGDGVTDFAPGDGVFGVVLSQPLSAGAFADFVVVPEKQNVAPIPAGMDHATAGVTGLAGAAATGSIDAVGLHIGDTVLVSGATGGVGAFAMQMAVAKGATVIATAAPGAESEHVRGLGAHHIIDYTGDVAAQMRAIAPGGVDVVLHYAGDPFALADLVVDGGRLATLLGIPPDQFGDRKIIAHSVIASPERSLLERLGQDVLSGKLRIHVSRTYGLDTVPQAFSDFAAGTLGKLAVTVA